MINEKWRKITKSPAYNMVTIFYGVTKRVSVVAEIVFFSLLTRYFVRDINRGFLSPFRPKKSLSTSPCLRALPILGPKETAVSCHEALPCEFYCCPA